MKISSYKSPNGQIIGRNSGEINLRGKLGEGEYPCQHLTIMEKSRLPSWQMGLQEEFKCDTVQTLRVYFKLMLN